MVGHLEDMCPDIHSQVCEDKFTKHVGIPHEKSLHAFVTRKYDNGSHIFIRIALYWMPWLDRSQNMNGHASEIQFIAETYFLYDSILSPSNPVHVVKAGISAMDRIDPDPFDRESFKDMGDSSGMIRVHMGYNHKIKGSYPPAQKVGCHEVPARVESGL